MRLTRLLLASAACALAATAATAQTSTTTQSTTTRSSSQTGAQTGAMSAGAMSAGAMQQSGASTGMSGTMGASTGGMQNGTISSGMTQNGAAGSAVTGPAAGVAAYRPISGSPSSTIVAVLQQSGQFTTLLKAVKATNLTSVLSGPGHLTVFAPTDSAFASLPAGTLETLMKPSNASQLQQFVLLHVVNTKIMSTELKGHTAINVPTVATGKQVHLDGSSGTVMVDDSTVEQADVAASNGVIQVISKALSPSYTPPAAPTPSSAAAASAGAQR